MIYMYSILFFPFRYSFAIVGINITGVAFDLLRKGHLKTHFYNAVQGRPTVENFNYVYCKFTLWKCLEVFYVTCVHVNRKKSFTKCNLILNFVSLIKNWKTVKLFNLFIKIIDKNFLKKKNINHNFYFWLMKGKDT